MSEKLAQVLERLFPGFTVLGGEITEIDMDDGRPMIFRGITFIDESPKPVPKSDEGAVLSPKEVGNK